MSGRVSRARPSSARADAIASRSLGMHGARDEHRRADVDRDQPVGAEASVYVGAQQLREVDRLVAVLSGSGIVQGEPE